MKKLFCFFLLLPLIGFGQTNNWEIVGDTNMSDGPANTPEIAFSPTGELYATYMQVLHSGRIVVKKFDTAWQIVGDSAELPLAQYTNIAVNSLGVPYVAFQDFNLNNKASVMKYADTGWVYVGTPGFSADTVIWVDLAISPTNVPYVIFSDVAHSFKTTAMKFDGTNWVLVGSPGFSVEPAQYIKMAFAPNGDPYVTFAGTQKIYVMNFTGSSWQNVGSSGISSGGGAWSDIVINSAGNIFVSYVDSAHSNKVTVMKFNGTIWAPVGNPGFTQGSVLTTSIDLDTDGKPNVSFNDSVYDSKATVMKYNGTEWVNVGNPGFTPGPAFMSTLVFNPLGQPYVIFINDNYSNSVMKFDSLYTGINDLSTNKLFVYPNPANEFVVIDLPAGMNTGTVEIIGLTGNIIESIPAVSGKVSVNIVDYPSGIYFARINTSKTIFIQKFVKR